MIKQNPFSVYDFMGYFIPGALLIYLYVFIDWFKNTKSEFNLSEFMNSNTGFQIDQVFFFIIISYALGHIINFISSMTIEKYAIWKYDYPSKFLLGSTSNKYWRKNNFSGYILRFILPFLILPISIFDLLLGELLNLKDVYTRKLDDFLIEIIKFKALCLMHELYKNADNKNDDINIAKFDFFRIIAHYAYENSKNHQSKLSNYVALYGFLRSLTLITIICFWYSIYTLSNDIHYSNYYIYAVGIFGFISYLFFMAFMKFYRRYTLEGLMIIAIDKKLVEKE